VENWKVRMDEERSDELTMSALGTKSAIFKRRATSVITAIIFVLHSNLICDSLRLSQYGSGNDFDFSEIL